MKKKNLAIHLLREHFTIFLKQTLFMVQNVISTTTTTILLTQSPY